uniref:Uncharacterized protein n=1 Tax=Plectus sambesii TaxID=2011161 RepID=A0A914W095_9BILA
MLGYDAFVASFLHLCYLNRDSDDAAIAMEDFVIASGVLILCALILIGLLIAMIATVYTWKKGLSRQKTTVQPFFVDLAASQAQQYPPPVYAERKSDHIFVCTAFSQCPLGGCPAEWRGPLLWPVVAMRLWAIVDATGENRPACRKGLSPVYSQLSCYQFPDPQRDEHLGWVIGRPQRESNPRPREW